MHERSRLLVDPKLQWSLALRVFLHWVAFLICLLTIGIVVRVLFAAGSASMGTVLREGLTSQLSILLVMVLLLPMFLRDTLKMSNRFAGPMHRLRTQLRNLATDQPATNISFRLGDFWQEVPSDFNHVLGQLNRLKEENATLRRQLESARSASPADQELLA